MAIDWKTIISEFDGKPTLLQAVGKLRKAVEDETITIQQAQAEIAKLEAQQKADEALITTAQTTATNAQSAAQAADTKAQNAQSAAQAADTKAQAADTKAQQALDLATRKLYMHSIKFEGNLGTAASDGSIKITVYSYSQEPFTFSTLGSYLNNVEIPAYGRVKNSDWTDYIGIPNSLIIGTTYTLYWFKFSDSSMQITDATRGNITDTVTEV